MPDSVEVRRDSVQSVCLILIAMVAVATALIYTRMVMIPFILSLFVAQLVAPVIRFLEQKWKFPRALAILATALLVVAGLAMATTIVSSAVREALMNMGAYKERVLEMADRTLRLVESLGMVENLGIKTGRAQFLQYLSDLPFFAYVQSTAGTLMSFAMNTVLITIFVIFLLTGGPAGLPKDGIVREIDTKIRVFLATKAVTSLTTGVLTGIILAFMGLDMAAMFGFLAFLLNFIPNLGSMIAVILPLPVALLQFDTVWGALGALALPGAVQFLIGNVVEPKVMGGNLDLHPVTVLLSLLFWGLIWGIPGALLATPLIAILKISLARTQRARWLAEVMAGRMPQDFGKT